MKKNKEHFHFTFTNIEKQYKKALDLGYNLITCKKFADNQNKLKKHTTVNRVDIDLSVKKAGRLGNIFSRLGIKGTFFIRLHEPKYNPFSFENYRIIKSFISNGIIIGENCCVGISCNLRKSIESNTKVSGSSAKFLLNDSSSTK